MDAQKPSSLLLFCSCLLVAAACSAAPTADTPAPSELGGEAKHPPDRADDGDTTLPAAPMVEGETSRAAAKLDAAVVSPLAADASQLAEGLLEPTRAPDAGESWPPDPPQSESESDPQVPSQTGRAPASDPKSPPPVAFDGEPLPGARGTWTYTEFQHAHCRDGSPTGVSVNLGSANKLMIFLEGGGLCDDPQTCAISPPNIEDPIAVGQALTARNGVGIFNRQNGDNPLRDWSVVYVHYCSGDRYGGDNPDAFVPGVGPQQLLGYANMKHFLQRIAPTFRDVTDVLLTGVSAGGAGAEKTSLLVQRAFPWLKIKVINDSGPPLFGKDMAPTCLQARWRSLGRFDRTFLAECGAACPDQNDYLADYAQFLATTLQDRPTGMIQTAEDWVERTFFGMGKDDCTGSLDFLSPAISPEAYRAALLAYRERMRKFPNYATFYVDGDWTTRSMHTWLLSDALYTVSSGGVRLIDWVTKIVDGQSPGHAGL